MKNNNSNIIQQTSSWVLFIGGNILWVLIHFFLLTEVPLMALLIANLLVLSFQLYFFKTQPYKLAIIVLITAINMYLLHDHMEFVTIINKCSGDSVRGYNETTFDSCLSTLSFADKINYGLFNNKVTFSK